MTYLTQPFGHRNKMKIIIIAEFEFANFLGIQHKLHFDTMYDYIFQNTLRPMLTLKRVTNV